MYKEIRDYLKLKLSYLKLDILPGCAVHGYRLKQLKPGAMSYCLELRQLALESIKERKRFLSIIFILKEESQAGIVYREKQRKRYTKKGFSWHGYFD